MTKGIIRFLISWKMTFGGGVFAVEKSVKGLATNVQYTRDKVAIFLNSSVLPKSGFSFSKYDSCQNE